MRRRGRRAPGAGRRRKESTETKWDARTRDVLLRAALPFGRPDVPLSHCPTSVEESLSSTGSDISQRDAPHARVEPTVRADATRVVAHYSRVVRVPIPHGDEDGRGGLESGRVSHRPVTRRRPSEALREVRRRGTSCRGAV